jgi:hypothetical protein
MWSISAHRLAALLCLVAGMAQAQSVQEGRQCPPQRGTHRLEDVRVFSGPPAKRVELAPRPGGWDLIVGPGPVEPGRRRDTLLCSYTGSAEHVTVVLPYDTSVCEFNARTWPHVVCR